MTMKDETGRTPPLVDQLNAAIRDNPLAAGRIGAGVAWMLLGPKGLGAMAGAAKASAGTAATAAGAAAGVGSAAAAAGSRAADAVKGAAGTLKDAASAARDATKDAAAGAMESAPALVPEMPDTARAGEAMADMRAAVGEQVRAAAASGREYGAAIQSRLSESLERQPLLLGAIGLAIGAGIASSFATTAVEQEWMGKTADAAREKAGEVGDALTDQARRVLTEVQAEAERQGLTTGAAKDAAASVAGKVRTVAETARDTARKDFNPRD
jgi:hypothetical protein